MRPIIPEAFYRPTLLFLWTIVCAHVRRGRGGGALVSAFDPSGDNTYASWLAQRNLTYKHSYLLTSPDNDDDVAVAMHWSVDVEEDLLRVAVAAEASGWLGFGLAEVGGMPGADIVVFTASDGSLTDLHATAYEQPHEDTCQDWTLVNSSTAGGFIIWEAMRKLSTGDTQDRVILDDSHPEIPPTAVIAAYGDDNSLAFHGKNRFKAKVRFFSEVGDATLQFLTDMTAEGAKWKDLRAPSTYVIPTKPTTYEYFCMTASEMGITDKKHAIGFFPIVQNLQHVHHMNIWAAESENLSCSSKEFHSEGVLFHSWGKGNSPFALPVAAGYPVGGADGFKSFLLEMHYNNPDGKQGIQDSSGHRIYFADQLRQHDAAYLRIADPMVSLIGTRLQPGLTKHVFDCPSTCTQNYFEASEVTIFLEHLHTHSKGARISNQLIRSGAVIHDGVVDYYDFPQEASFSVQQPLFVMQKGDAFRTTCYYNTTGDTAFGLTSEDEMCIAFFGYYPKQPIPKSQCGHSRHPKKRFHECSASYNGTSVVEAGLGRTFDANPDQCDAMISFSTRASTISLSFFALILVAIILLVLISVIVYYIYRKKWADPYVYAELSLEEPLELHRLPQLS